VVVEDLGRSSGGAFDGGAISTHSQAIMFDPLTPQSLICKQGENKLRSTIHNNLTHIGFNPILAMEGHDEEEEQKDFKDNNK
jgi:hypothetical protein